MPAHHQSNVMGYSKMVVLIDVDYLGPDSCTRPMLLGRENQYHAVQKLLTQLFVQRRFLAGWPIARPNLQGHSTSISGDLRSYAASWRRWDSGNLGNGPKL